MNKDKISIKCDKCGVEMIPKNRSEPILRKPIATTTTAPGISASQADFQNSEELSEWIEFECPKCFGIKVEKV